MEISNIELFMILFIGLIVGYYIALCSMYSNIKNSDTELIELRSIVNKLSQSP